MKALTKEASDRLDRFFKKERPFLFAFVYRMCGAGEDAEDIAQNSLLEAFLEYAENPDLEPTRLWAMRSLCRELRQAISKRRPWQAEDFRLVLPLMTDERFFRDLQEEFLVKNPRLSDKESFHVGFLTLLQRLPFEERLAYLAGEILGYAPTVVAELAERSVADIESSRQKAAAYMDRLYFAAPGGESVWRNAAVKADDLEPFLTAIQEKDHNAIRKAISLRFQFVAAEESMGDDDEFLDEFLPKAPACYLLDFEINGQPCFCFTKGEEPQALGVAIRSSKGVVETLLTFSLDQLSPKIRNRIEEPV